MRVLHVITSGELGGAQVHLVAVVRELARAGVDVEVACGPGGFVARALARDAPVHEVPSLRSRPGPLADMKALSALIALARGRDVVHTHSAKAGALGRIAARVVGVPRIMHTSHGSFLSERRSALGLAPFLAIERMAAAVTTHLFVLSRADLELMRAHGLYRHTPCDVVRIAPDRVARPRGAWAYAERLPLIVTVANHYENKGVDVLIRAFSLLRAEIPNARLRLIGDGPLRADLERLAAVIAPGVEFLGSVADPTDALLEASVFVLPSRKEGLPIALLEALALGVPAVATRVGGVDEVVTPDEVELVVPNDAPALAGALMTVLTRPSRAQVLATNGRAAAARFVASATVAPILAAYTGAT